MSDREFDRGVCHYCGLPLPGRSRPADLAVPSGNDQDRGQADPADPEPAEPEYCCFGCKLAESITSETGAEGQARWTLTRLGLAVFFSMNVMVFTLALWTQDVYSEQLRDGPPTAVAFHQLLRYLCLLFALPVMLLLAGPLVEGAWEQLRRRTGLTDLLLLLGVFAAFGYSVLSVLRGEGHVYFEVACMVLVFVTLGRWLEATGKIKTTSVLRSLEKLLPDQVHRLSDGRTTQVPAGEVVIGDTLRVRAGERIAVDGRVLRNQASVDQQAVTGESRPVLKRPGDCVLSGSLNLDGDLWVMASSTAGGSTLQQVIAAVEQAALRGERHQRLADRVASWFLPGVIAVAAGTFLMHGWQADWQAGSLAALAVVLIACPCALGLATPMALWAALGRACQAQILFREGDALTRLAEAELLYFDKTGTLSTGNTEVESLRTAPGTPRAQVLRVASGLARSNTHALSTAIARYAEGVAGSEGVEVKDPRSLPGRGVRAEVTGIAGPAYLGSGRWMNELEQREGQLEQREGQDGLPAAISGRFATHRLADGEDGGADDLSRVYVAWAGEVRGCFTLREELRREAADALSQLRALGCRLEILSGDDAGRVAALADQLGVSGQGDLLPDAKQRVIAQARRRGHTVVMVGDGINDAPALALADVGVALGSGTDVSRQSAGVCLLGNDLLRLPWAIELARTTVRTIRWNLLWAFGYNTVGIVLAAAGWLNPILAAAAMVGSSLLVVTNSLRLAGLALPADTAADRRGGPPRTENCRDAGARTLGASDSGELDEGDLDEGRLDQGTRPSAASDRSARAPAVVSEGGPS